MYEKNLSSFSLESSTSYNRLYTFMYMYRIITLSVMEQSSRRTECTEKATLAIKRLAFISQRKVRVLA